MLKAVRRYLVEVYLNDRLHLNCQLLSPPTTEVLAEIAKVQDAHREVIEALSFFREINLPDVLNDAPRSTEIVIAEVVLGSILVTEEVIYKQPVKRSAKTAN